MSAGKKKKSAEAPQHGTSPDRTQVDATTLAELASRLYPEECKNATESALLGAWLFYHQTTVFIDRVRKVGIERITREWLETESDLVISGGIPSRSDEKWLRLMSDGLYLVPSDETDGVRDWLRTRAGTVKVNSARTVINRLRKFLGAESNSFFTRVVIRDPRTNAIARYSIPKSVLEELIKFEHERRKDQKRKSWKTRKNADGGKKSATAAAFKKGSPGVQINRKKLVV